jgi:tetratricopeptide (TPR) repeat protein
MGRRVVHVVLVALALAGLAIGLRAWLGGPLIAFAAAVWLGWWLVGTILMPRLAHAAFVAGDTARARRRYLVLGVVSPAARDASRVSIAGSHLVDRDYRRALCALAAIDGGRLPGLLRAAWLNNRAYALVRDGRDPAEALALIDEALALRPGVPGFLHTRGLALLADDHLDDAIRAFEAVWDAGEIDPRLEAERCHDLAVAWERKGHADYAADYRLRAARAAPTSPWARAEDVPLADLEAQIAR